MFNNIDDRDTNNFRENIGIVAVDKPEGSRDIEVVLPEITPSMKGPLGSRQIREEVTSVDHNGKESSSVVHSSNTVRATWYGETNRPYPPDVVKGETVIVIQYGDADQYYWRSSGRSDDLRKTEIVRLAAANSQSTTKTLTDENTYGITMNTKDQSVSIHTSKGTGEQFSYIIKIDAAGSKISVQDDVGNGWMLDSENTKIMMVNKLGTSFICDKEDAFIVAPRDLVLKAGRQVVFDTPVNTWSNTSGAGVSEFQSNGMTFNTKNFTVNSETIGLNGPTKVNAPLVSGPMRAEGYSTGSRGSGYEGATSDVPSGSGKNPTNVPDGGTGDGSNRHCAAQEDTLAAFQTVATSIHMLEQHVGITTPVDDAVTSATSSKMSLNQGK